MDDWVQYINTSDRDIVKLTNALNDKKYDKAKEIALKMYNNMEGLVMWINKQKNKGIK